MENIKQLEKKHEDDFSSYNFETVEENANPTEYFEEQNDEEFNEKHSSSIINNSQHYKKLNKLLSTKEIFDRVGYGFAAHQFITILFFLSGAGIFLVGFIQAIRSFLTSLFSSILREYSTKFTVSRKLISTSGIFFGFSFIGLILALRVHSPTLFAIFLLIGSAGIVTYGELYDRLLKEEIKYERKNKFLKNITHIGLVITAISFFISGALIQFVGMNGNKIIIFNKVIPITGYFISFELAAIMFILSGFILKKLPLKNQQLKASSKKHFLKTYFFEIKEQTKIFFTDKNLSLLYFGAIIISSIEILGSTYYGYVIYLMFKNQLFGGFFNVAIIFGVAIFASFLGPKLTKFLHHKIGLSPMFVFGSLLIAIMPLTLIFNNYFFAILAAASCVVIGSSILGVAQALLARKLLSPSLRKVFFKSIELLLVVPFLIFVTVGAFIAWFWSFKILFAVMLISLVILAGPIYFVLVLRANRKRL